MYQKANNLSQNSLERGFGGCKPYRKPKRRPKVTIAIGLISGNQHGANFLRPTIFLASDSQTTRGATKSLDTQKISIVSFPEYEILIAQAGSADLADKAIEVLRGKAKGTPVETIDTILRTIQDSIREIRSHLTSLNQDCGFSADDWKRFFLEDNYFQLLVAFYYDRKPHLYTVDIDWCLAIPAKSNYCAIGIGKDMGEFLIREHLLADPDLALAFSISVSVIEKTIDNVDGCGRPVWVLAAVFASGMHNAVMTFPLFQILAICQTLIGVHGGLFVHAFVQNFSDVLVRDVAHHSRLHISAALNQGHNWRLTGHFGASVAFSANVSFIRFHDASQLSTICHVVAHCEANAVRHEPRCFVLNLEHPVKLVSAD